jgi:hypothetical protein
VKQLAALLLALAACFGVAFCGRTCADAVAAFDEPGH